jgi:hypothetical protein
MVALTARTINVLVELPAAAHEGALKFAFDAAVVAAPIDAIRSGRKLRIGRLEGALDVEILITVEIRVLAAQTAAQEQDYQGPRQRHPDASAVHAVPPLRVSRRRTGDPILVPSTRDVKPQYPIMLGPAGKIWFSFDAKFYQPAQRLRCRSQSGILRTS